MNDNQSMDPEYLELINLLKNQSDSQFGFTGKELNEEEFIFDPFQNKSLQRKTQAQLMMGAHFSIEDQRLIYRHYFAKTFPFFFLSEEKFKNMVDKFGWNPGQIKGLFRAFRGKSIHINHLSFPEFISGLAACEQNTPHGDGCGESRCRYIFRYYDLNNNGKLDFQEFCHMVSDIRALRGVSNSPAEVIAEAENSAKVFEANQSEVLTMSDFLSGVGQLKFRGTSGLLRSPKSVISVLSN